MEKVAQAAFSYSHFPNDGSIEIKFVSKKEITRLNMVYRKIDGPTDVLSFTISQEPLVGQIFICYTYVVNQAKKIGKKLDDEIALLVVHGILHVYGYDHITLDQEKEMQQLERNILGSRGIAR